MTNDVSIQRAYYRNTASLYDAMHLDDSEHNFALAFLLSCLTMLGCGSVLDVGAGTGRAPLHIRQHRPEVFVCGLEPSKELRDQAYLKGMRREEMIGGDACALPFPDAAFDLVCEFGALHHIPKPHAAVSEMLRVAKLAVFISDNNNFGSGPIVVRAIKQLINSLGLWRVFDMAKTRG